MFKLVKREKKIQQLLGSFPQKEKQLRKKVYHIDSSIKHNQLILFGPAEKTILSQAIKQLVLKEQKQIRQQQKAENKTQMHLMQQKLHRFGRKTTHSKTIHFGRDTKSRMSTIIGHCHKQKTIFIERKYNNQISYQIQNILQAKRIEQDKFKLNKHLKCRQESPLINDVIRITRSQCKTVQNRPKLNNFFINTISQQQTCFKNDIVSTSFKKILQNQKIRAVMEVCQRRDVRPIHPNSSNNLKRLNPHKQSKKSAITSPGKSQQNSFRKML